MRAVRWHGRRDVRYETVPDAPAPGPEQVRVAVAWCGLCGTDLLEYREGPIEIPTRPHPVTGGRAPVVLGHEVSGFVDEVGAGVTGLAPGALVALNALIPCGRCALCAGGAYHLCPDFGHIGMSADGGLAELVTVPARMVVAAPAGLDPAVAALAEPFAVAWHLVRRLGRPGGREALIVGAGSIGLATALILRAEGDAVTLADVGEERLAVPRALGLSTRRADLDPPASAADLTVDCTGTGPGFALACAAARPGGTVGLAGLPGAPVPFDLAAAAKRELTLVGSMSHQTTADLRPALAFLAQHAEAAAALITGRVALADAVTGGLDVLTGAERGRHIKILVAANPTDSGRNGSETGSEVGQKPGSPNKERRR
ncbi:alcohol dehydrogenase catalytic domain-containing protein [Streptomyces sp. 3MP-14]|uniref:Alcohol dehydrogenase catalytic domain-containing protein n=1 Tax=Streptomyces mimosae TaxID=2586635 RepID=A0A5N6A8Q3_9ACTN|nr:MULTISPECIES: alcohol dehydrogenase catalytic domain-containing protein [Streptomyces]KAB8164299.1 alcohol dehydrogenase catalytic domain-containing protein [Streptomyces mimosae]KAB8176576.1 alcohol dehydrogenase catalytic domain-containing protein [Streptomyces sp. 3MP-14]